MGLSRSSGDIKRKKKAYRYYRCTSAIKNGRGVCDTGTVPAQELERIVVDEVRGLATDRSLLKQVLDEAHATIHEELGGLRKDRDEQKRELSRFHKELRQLVTKKTARSETTARMAELHQGITEAEQRLPALDKRIAELERETVSREEAEAVFADFDTLWSNLIPREQARLLKLLISVVDYDANAGTIAVTFRPSSIAALARKHLEEAA